MSFYWLNGRRIQRRGRESMNVLAGSLDRDTVVIDSMTFSENEKSTDQIASPTKGHSPSDATINNTKHGDTKRNSCDEKLFENLIGRNFYSSTKTLLDEIDSIAGLNKINQFIENIHVNFDKLQEAFRESHYQPERIEFKADYHKRTTFFEEPSPENEFCNKEEKTSHWCVLPQGLISQPPSYTGRNQYVIDPLEIEKRLKKILKEIENDSNESSSIEGDDEDSETGSPSKRSYRVRLFSKLSNDIRPSNIKNSVLKWNETYMKPFSHVK